jgi:hypothetical protein
MKTNIYYINSRDLYFKGLSRRFREQIKINVKSKMAKIPDLVNKFESNLELGITKGTENILEKGGKALNLIGNGINKLTEDSKSKTFKIGGKLLGGTINLAGCLFSNQSRNISKLPMFGFKTIKRINIYSGKIGGKIGYIIGRKVGYETVGSKVGNIVTQLLIPGGALLATIMLFADVDDFDHISNDYINEILGPDPEVMEAFARSTSFIDGEATLDMYKDYLSQYDSSESYNGLINNIKGILGEIELKDYLNSQNNGIFYDLYEKTNNEFYDLYGKDAYGNIVEKIQVKMTENPSYVKESLEKLPEDTIIYVNQELSDTFAEIKNIKIVPIRSEDLEIRIIKFIERIRCKNL